MGKHINWKKILINIALVGLPKLLELTMKWLRTKEAVVEDPKAETKEIKKS